MQKSITTALIVGALVTIFLIFTACDALNLEANKIADLETKLDKIYKEYEKISIQYYDMLTINRALIAEKQDLTNRLTKANAIIKVQNTKLVKLAGIVPEPKKVEVKTFTIKFDNGEFYNKADSKLVAAKVIAIIKAHPVSRITVAGYSSHNGPADLNMKVSKARAEGVIDKIYEAHNDGPLHVDMVAYGEGSDNERKVVITVESMI